MAVKDPENYKLRGVRTTNDIWEQISKLAKLNGHSASKEVVVALKNHIRQAKKRGLI